MATVNLGNIKFKWKGTYNGGSSYTIDDVVEYNGSSYICKLASTGNLPTNTTYFDVMSQAGTNGTNGTDVGTVITTQGDLLYRDGSGLQRLGAGTAGQVLQTGGAGANPSWGTLSSDMVKIASVTATGSATEVNLEYDFTPYKNIIVKYYEAFPSSQTSIDFRVGTGSPVTYISGTNEYSVLGYGRYEYFGVSSGALQASGQYDRMISSIGWGTTFNQPQTAFGTLEIYNFNGTSGKYKGYRIVSSAYEAGYQVMENVGGWIQSGSSVPLTGIQCRASGQDVYGKFDIYGVK